MNNYLIHYGILGQRWGVQNGPPYPLSGEQKSSSEKKHYNIKAKDVQKNMDQMTDAELQKAINRLNMQAQVDRMNPSVIEKGRRVAERYKKDAGLALGIAAVTSSLVSKTGVNPASLVGTAAVVATVIANKLKGN